MSPSSGDRCRGPGAAGIVLLEPGDPLKHGVASPADRARTPVPGPVPGPVSVSARLVRRRHPARLADPDLGLAPVQIVAKPIREARLALLFGRRSLFGQARPRRFLPRGRGPLGSGRAVSGWVGHVSASSGRAALCGLAPTSVSRRTYRKRGLPANGSPGASCEVRTLPVCLLGSCALWRSANAGR